MRKAVKWLEFVKDDLDFYNVTHITLDLLDRAIAELKAPDRETPEEYKNRTGRPWADGSAVYMKVGKNDWRTTTYRDAKFTAECFEGETSCLIYCANSDAGIPENRA
jgi:hypothetical protein